MHFESTHKLDFMAVPWHRNGSMTAFKVGTCHGLYYTTDSDYVILSIINDSKGNGHFQDVLEWFENSCKRDKKNLGFMEIWNESLFTHLTKKKGFRAVSDKVVIKEKFK